MLQVIKQKLKALYQNVQQEFRNTPVQFLAAAAIIGGILLQMALTLCTKGSSSNRIINFLSKNTEINLLLIILSLGLLAWSSISLRQRTKHPLQNKFVFIDYAGVSWKIINPNSPNLEVDYPSYCIQHRVQHFIADRQYLCPVCSDKHMPYILNNNLRSTHKAVENLAKAKRDKHAQVKPK